MDDYTPLILATYKRLHPMLNSRTDKEDLMSQIRVLFARLVLEYDPRRGVDFPYYIKTMLNLRAYHYVTKKFKTKNREVLTESFTNDEFTFGELSQDHFDDIINILSWDSDFKMGKKQRKLFVGLLIEQKTLQELAEEEGIEVSVLHTRMHFLVKKLKEQAALQEAQEKESEEW